MMKSKIAKLGIVVDSKKAVSGSRKASRAINGVGKRADKTTKSMSGLKKAMIGAFTSYVVVRGVRALTEILLDEERALSQVKAGLESTNYASGQTVESTRALADEMQKLTGFSDNLIEEVAAIGSSFTNITGDVFPKFIKISADVATRMGTDLKNTSIQLAKALNDPVANLGALSRAGIQFSKDQKAVIKSLWETGRQAEAQEIILEELEKQYGGSAEAAHDTLGGALKGLKNAFKDLAKSFFDKEFSDGLKEMVQDLTKIIENVETVITKLKSADQFFKDTVKKIGSPLETARKNAMQEYIKKHGLIVGFKKETTSDLNKNITKANQQYEQQIKILDDLLERYEGLGDKIRAVAREQEKADQTRHLKKQREAIALLKTKLEELEQSSMQYGNAFAGAMEEAVLETHNLSEALRNLANDLKRMLFRQLITQPIANQIGGAISGARGGNELSGNIQTLENLPGSASGNMFTKPSMTRIAEKGQPEAVLPLKRGSNGQLGVQMPGGESNQAPPIIVNISAWDTQTGVERVKGALAEIAAENPRM